MKAKAPFVAHFGRLGIRGGRLALLAISVAAFLLIPASQAAAKHFYTGSFGPDGTEATSFVEPGPLAVDRQTHDVYVADTGSGTLYKFDENHQPVDFSALGSNKIEGLELHGFGEGQIAVDSGSHIIYVTNGVHFLAAFQANGEPAEFTAGPGAGSNEIGGFGELLGVAVDGNGAIYAGDYASGLKVFAPSGALLATLATSPSELEEPANLAVDSHGVVYSNHYFGAVDWLNPSAFPVSGSTSYSFEGTADANSAHSVAVDPSSDELYAAEFSPEAQIARYAGKGGAQLEVLGDTGPGELEEPDGVAVDGARGKVYASDTAGTGRVKVFGPPDHGPVATTGGSSEINFYLTNLEGTVNPASVEVEDCRFEYDTREYKEGEAAHGTSTPCVPNAAELEGSADEPVSAETEPLEPNTLYHYRLVASNLGGTSMGGDRTFSTGSAPDDSCPNAALRAAQGIRSILLPDCMALEMVSPPHKENHPAFGPEVSADGGRVRFRSPATLGGGPGNLNASGDPYVATREDSEWITGATSPPVEIVKGWNGTATAQSYTPDFSRWFQIAATQSQFQIGVGQAFRGGLGGLFAPISPLLTPPTGANRNDVERSEFQGASADQSHLYFIPGGDGADDHSTAYLPGDPAPTGIGSDHNTYVAHLNSGGQPSLELLARDRENKVWGGNCGTRLGGIRRSTDSEPNGERNQGAVSADGGRVYFSTRPGQSAAGSCNTGSKLRILERLETKLGPWIGELFTSECNRPSCDTSDGNDIYQGASVDGSRVYFTTTRELASSDLDVAGPGEECSPEVGESVGCDLYLYDSSLPSGQRLIQVSAGGAGDLTPGVGANVLNGIVAISGDGSHVYFAAQGVLTTDQNPSGEEAEAGKPNLYVWNRATEETSFVGTLDTGDDGGLWGVNQGTFRNQAYPVPALGKNAKGEEAAGIGGSGDTLLFESRASLTTDDTDGGHLDVFRFDADAVPSTMECISCRPGGVDSAPFDVASRGAGGPGGTDFAEEVRWTNEDGRTVVFSTAEALLPGDVNGIVDFYLWRNGQLYRLPGKANLPSEVALSHDGKTVAFDTTTPLLPQDGDSAADVYVARVEGGYPEPAVEEPCQVDESLPGRKCQEKEQPPVERNAASAAFAGAGNPKAVNCTKGKHRVKGRCVNRHRQHHKSKKHVRKGHPTRHVNADRRAGK